MGRAKRTAGWGGGGYSANAVKGWLGKRMAETFQDRLVTELRLAGASSIEEANCVLEQFLPRFNRRFRVPPQYPEPAFVPWTRSSVWNRSCASSTTEKLPGTTR